MTFRFLLFKKNLKNKSVKLFSIIISLSFAVVVAALLFSQSMITGMQNRLVYLSSGHIRLNSSAEIKVDGTTSEKVITGYAMIYSSDDTSDIIVKGVSEQYLDTRNKYIHISDINISGNSVIISRELSEKLKVKVDDYVAMMLMPDTTSKSVRPSVCRICGIYDSGYSEVDSKLIYTSLDNASLMFPSEESVSYEYILENYSETELKAVKKEFNNKAIVDWRSANYYVYMNFLTSQQAITMILYILTVFSAFLTLSLTQQLINDNSRDIAIIKLLGASNKQLVINMTFTILLTVTLCLIAGTIIGLILGTNLSSILKVLFNGSDAFKNYLLDFDVIIPYKSVLIQFISEILLSFAFIFISSLKTRKINPILLFR